MNFRSFSVVKCGGGVVIVWVEGNGGDEVGRGEWFIVIMLFYYVNVVLYMGSVYLIIVVDVLVWF